MRVLVPIDGSIPSIKALEYTMYLLRLMAPGANEPTNKISEITLITILPHYQVPNEIKKHMEPAKTSGGVTSLSQFLEKMNQMMETEWLNRLSEIKSRYLASGISIKAKLIEGGSSSRTIAEKIIKFSADEQMDLLVIGSIGLGGVSKIKALGSVSRNVGELSKRPVLVVH